MRRYSTLILSFIFSVIIFVALIIIQKNILNQEKGVQAYVLNKDVEAHENITSDMLDLVYILLPDDIEQNLIKELSNLDNYITKEKISKGKVLLRQDLIEKVDLENYIGEQYAQKVVIPISNIDNGLSCIMGDNSFINLYITIDSEYLPKDIDTYTQMNISSQSEKKVTFLYLEKEKPICFLDENGIVSNEEGFAKSVVLNLNKEQAMYINYIKGKAGFSITAI